MTARISLLGVAAAAFVVSTAAQGQHAHHAGEAGLGRISFATSCSPQVQARFDEATALLHAFEYSAIDRFAAIAAADPGCGMAWWGAAMSVRGNPLLGGLGADLVQAGRALIDKAKAAPPKTQRERGFIDALDVYFRDYGAAGHLARGAAYETAMEKVHRANPDDPEAAAFYGLAILEAVDLTDKTYARQLKGGAVLEDLLRRVPDHPGALHYIIHAYDYAPIAERGLAAARRYAQTAPASVHALHMPSHVFSMLGLWEESIAANRASSGRIDALAAAERGQGTRAHPGEHFHGYDFSLYAHLQLAQDKAAQALADELRPHGMATLADARIALERGDWRAAEGLRVPAADRGPIMDVATSHFARAIGAARLKDGGAAMKEAGALQDLVKEVERREGAYWAKLTSIYARAAEAWAVHAQGGRDDDALAVMRDAADRDDAQEKHILLENKLTPMRELYGELLLELGRHAEAAEAILTSLKSSPRRFRAYAGLVQAMDKLGRADETREWRAKLAELAGKADSERRESIDLK